MEPVHISGKKLIGLSVRTRNADEMSQETAQIPALWEQFFQDMGAQALEGKTLYGLYSKYESDHTGSFDVSATIEGLEDERHAQNQEVLVLLEGRYLVFKPESQVQRGDLGEQVLQLWMQAWSYFQKKTYPTNEHSQQMLKSITQINV